MTPNIFTDNTNNKDRKRIKIVVTFKVYCAKAKKVIQWFMCKYRQNKTFAS